MPQPPTPVAGRRATTGRAAAGPAVLAPPSYLSTTATCVPAAHISRPPEPRWAGPWPLPRAPGELCRQPSPNHRHLAAQPPRQPVPDLPCARCHVEQMPRRLLLCGGNWPRVDGAPGSGGHGRGAGSDQPGLSVSAPGIRPGAGAAPLSPVVRFYKKLPCPLVSHVGWLLEAKRIKCCRDSKVLNKKMNYRQFHLELGNLALSSTCV